MSGQKAQHTKRGNKSDEREGKKFQDHAEPVAMEERSKTQDAALTPPVERQSHAWSLTLRTFTAQFDAHEYLDAKISPSCAWIALLTLRRQLRLCSLPGSEGDIKFFDFEVEDVQQ